MTLRQLLILLSGATQAQAKGIISNEWYHYFIVSMMKKEVIDNDSDFSGFDYVSFFAGGACVLNRSQV